MRKPIQAGDLCTVISGMSGSASPNIGLVVEVISRVYECPKYGVIWRCKAEFAVRVSNNRPLVPNDMADFAQDWLKKIEPPKTSSTDQTTTEIQEELKA